MCYLDAKSIFVNQITTAFPNQFRLPSHLAPKRKKVCSDTSNAWKSFFLSLTSEVKEAASTHSLAKFFPPKLSSVIKKHFYILPFVLPSFLTGIAQSWPLLVDVCSFQTVVTLRNNFQILYQLISKKKRWW